MKPHRKAVSRPPQTQPPAPGRSLEVLERKLRFAEVLLGISQKVAGVIPKDHQTGTGQVSYLAHAVAAKIAAPTWTKEDMFVV